ncbi:MAG: SAM-dependent methyltransferase [Lachnospiraceae bacterium]|nr:SAM-dependent methyltransferase [Lachnospiraceae bacterium]
MQLSERLTAVAGFVTEGNRLADIGTDHGYVPIYLVEQGKIPSAIAMDINKGPLERAKEHIKEYNFTDKIQVRLSDGLEKLEAGEADTVLIAGMGGNLIVRILQNGSKALQNIKELVLSPHSEIDIVREYLCQNKYEIVEENMVYDSGKYYTVIKAIPCEKEVVYMPEELEYGRYMKYGDHKVFSDYVDYENRKLKELIDNLSKQSSENAKERIVQLEYNFKLNEKVREGNGANVR